MVIVRIGGKIQVSVVNLRNMTVTQGSLYGAGSTCIAHGNRRMVVRVTDQLHSEGRWYVLGSQAQTCSLIFKSLPSVSCDQQMPVLFGHQASVKCKSVVK